MLKAGRDKNSICFSEMHLVVAENLIYWRERPLLAK